MATHFKKVRDPEGKQEFLWEPCSPGDPQAEEKDLMSIDSEQLRPIDVNTTYVAYICALRCYYVSRVNHVHGVVCR